MEGVRASNVTIQEDHNNRSLFVARNRLRDNSCDIWRTTCRDESDRIHVQVTVHVTVISEPLNGGNENPLVCNAFHYDIGGSHEESFGTVNAKGRSDRLVPADGTSRNVLSSLASIAFTDQDDSLWEVAVDEEGRVCCVDELASAAC